MRRSYYSDTLEGFLTSNKINIMGSLTTNCSSGLNDEQKDAWAEQIDILKEGLKGLHSGYIIFEYVIPRMGRRVDTVLIYAGLIFVIEFKVYEKTYPRHAIDQCMDYALDLKNFQEASYTTPIVPILVSTEAHDITNKHRKFDDGVFGIIKANRHNLGRIITDIAERHRTDQIDGSKWENSQYKPTPTIIEAARALYQGHDVEEISRNDAGAMNLNSTTSEIEKIITKSRKEGLKSICFVTGVPGAGKTLAGLNIANKHHHFDDDTHAVFLSGNGPLVQVLQEALARDKVANSRVKKGEALRATKSFIQNIHHFRDDMIRTSSPPNERVVIFDEAQRAWDKRMTVDFMKRKKGIKDFDMSEPEFLISTMDRHDGWAVIICLVGGGQEINRGEAGIAEWFRALKKNEFASWNVYVSNEITDVEYTQGEHLEELLSGMKIHYVPDLHLRSSVRSFRSERVSQFIKLLLDCKEDEAKRLLDEICQKYPIVMTRSLHKAKQWLRGRARGSERYGVTASAKAHRLRPYGIYSGFELNAPRWFLNSKDDLRSSFYLEYVASEFDIQGLELDWTCVAWDGNFRYVGKDWSYNEFRGHKWTLIRKDDNKSYLKNAYRVLLTRARQGMVIFVPIGDENDKTRKKEYYDSTYKYLLDVGITDLDTSHN